MTAGVSLDGRSIVARTGGRVEVLADEFHRAIIAAHTAGFFVDFVACAAFLSGKFGVNRQINLRVPIKNFACASHLQIPIAGTFDAFDNVGGMCGNSADDNSVVHVVNRRQAKIFGSRDVTQKIRAAWLNNVVTANLSFQFPQSDCAVFG